MPENAINRYKLLMSVALSDDKLHPLEVALLNNYAAKHDVPIDVQREVMLNPASFAISDKYHSSLDTEFLIDVAKLVLVDDIVEESEITLMCHYIKALYPHINNLEGAAHLVVEWVEDGVASEEISRELKTWV